MKKVAFIGLGLMGLSMARNIIKAGHTVVGFDREASQMQLHVANGGEIADSAALATAGADFVITMLPVGSIVTSAILANKALPRLLPMMQYLLICRRFIHWNPMIYAKS